MLTIVSIEQQTDSATGNAGAGDGIARLSVVAGGQRFKDIKPDLIDSALALHDALPQQCNEVSNKLDFITKIINYGDDFISQEARSQIRELHAKIGQTARLAGVYGQFRLPVDGAEPEPSATSPANLEMLALRQEAEAKLAASREFEALTPEPGYLKDYSGDDGIIRKMTPADFLCMFNGWILDQYNTEEETLRWNKRKIKALQPAATVAWNTRKSASLHHPDLIDFCGLCLETAEIETTFPELDELYSLARDSPDNLGEFTFTSAVHRRWFEKFLLSDKRRACWQACGYTMKDMVKIQNYQRRQKLGVWQGGRYWPVYPAYGVVADEEE